MRDDPLTMIIGNKVPSTFYQVWINVLELNTCRIYQVRDIVVFLFLIVREISLDECNPQATIQFLDLIPKEWCVEVDGNRSIGRENLRHHLSVNARKYNVLVWLWKGLGQSFVGHTTEYYSHMQQMWIMHERDPLSNNL